MDYFLYFLKGILNIEFKKEVLLEGSLTSQDCSKAETKFGNFCLIHFASYSAARKTLETILDVDTYQVDFCY